MAALQERSKFAQMFASVYRDVTLPSIYREFILTDSYLPYQTSFIRGLWTYGATDVELSLSSSILLNRQQLFDQSDIEASQASEYHPIAVVHNSPQFLAIDTTMETAPVFLWHHETGGFREQFATFVAFVRNLRTPAAVRQELETIRQTFAEIRAVCEPAALRARHHLIAGRLDEAAAELDAVLVGRRPIRYDGRNDFEAIGILCDCFNLRGLVFLARGDLEAARTAFFDATECGGTPYWEAAVDAIVISFLLKNIQPAIDQVGQLQASDFPEPPGSIVRRNFNAQHVAQLKAIAKSPDLSTAEQEFARRVLSWIPDISAQ